MGVLLVAVIDVVVPAGVVALVVTFVHDLNYS